MRGCRNRGAPKVDARMASQDIPNSAIHLRTILFSLLDLAPDIQEQILFLPLIQGLNERNLRWLGASQQ